MGGERVGKMSLIIGVTITHLRFSLGLPLAVKAMPAAAAEATAPPAAAAVGDLAPALPVDVAVAAAAALRCF